MGICQPGSGDMADVWVLEKGCLMPLKGTVVIWYEVDGYLSRLCVEFA